MKFGGLSETEVEEISTVLNQNGISFEVSQDDEIQSFNSQSMKNDLRHFSPPNISTHCLAIMIEDNDFLRISGPGRESLLRFGITDQAPAPEDFVPHDGKTIHEDLARDTNRIVAMNMKHQLILLAMAVVLVWLLKKMFF